MVVTQSQNSCVSDVTCQCQVLCVSSQCQSSWLAFLFMFLNPQMLSDHFGRFWICWDVSACSQTYLGIATGIILEILVERLNKEIRGDSLSKIAQGRGRSAQEMLHWAKSPSLK